MIRTPGKTFPVNSCVWLLSLVPVLAFAGPMQAEPVGAWEMAKVTAGLLVVLGMIVATAAGLKRLKALPGGRGGHIKMVDGISVSTRDRVVLLEVEKRRILLGVSPGRIETLHVFAGESMDEQSFAAAMERAMPEVREGQPS